MKDFINPAGISSLSNEDIEIAESNVGPIPTALQDILRKINGGMPEKPLFVTDEGDDYNLDYIFPISESKNEPTGQNLAKINMLLKERKLIPNDYLVFGSDPGGNYFSVKKTDGTVWYHPMDVWEENRSPEDNQEKTMERLSKTLKEFFAALLEED